MAQLPVLWKHPGLFHHGMHPGDAAGDIRIFDAVAGLRVVHHDFTGSAAALDINLEEDGGLGLGDANPVIVNQALQHDRVYHGPEKGDQVGIVIETDAAGDHVVGDEAQFLGSFFVQPGRTVISPIYTGFQVRMVGKELFWIVVVAAAGLVVAAAHGFV